MPKGGIKSQSEGDGLDLSYGSRRHTLIRLLNSPVVKIHSRIDQLRTKLTIALCLRMHTLSYSSITSLIYKNRPPRVFPKAPTPSVALDP